MLASSTSGSKGRWLIWRTESTTDSETFPKTKKPNRNRRDQSIPFTLWSIRYNSRKSTILYPNFQFNDVFFCLLTWPSVTTFCWWNAGNTTLIYQKKNFIVCLDILVSTLNFIMTKTFRKYHIKDYWFFFQLHITTDQLKTFLSEICSEVPRQQNLWYDIPKRSYLSNRMLGLPPKPRALKVRKPNKLILNNSE